MFYPLHRKGVKMSGTISEDAREILAGPHNYETSQRLYHLITSVTLLALFDGALEAFMLFYAV